MAERSATRPQVIDDKFVDDMVRDLSVVGSLGVLNVADGILPVYLLGQRSAFQLNLATPAFDASNTFSAGAQTGTTAGDIMADTLVLPAGQYDIELWLDGDHGNAFQWQLFWLTAGGANKVRHDFFTNTEHGHAQVVMAVELEEGERLQLKSGFTHITVFVQGTILARLRS